MRDQDIITIINAVKDSKGAIIGWKNTVIEHAHVEQQTSIQSTTTSRSREGTTLVMIWLNDVTTAGYSKVSAKEFSEADDRTNLFSLSVGDYIVRGCCTDIPQAGKPLREFVQQHEVLQITMVEDCLYGSYSMQHWEVEAK